MRALSLVAGTLVVVAIMVGHAQDEEGENADLPLEAGRTIAIDTDEGSWLSLDVSPDGQTIVFDLLGDLYTLPFGGGDATPLTEGMAYDSQPRYSPDGSRLVFVSDRDGAENLWTIDVETGETDRITTGKTSSYESPEWLDDLYVVAARANNALSGGDGRNPKLWMWHVNGGTGIQLIKEPGTLRTTGPVPTPDGRHIWFAQRERLWQYNAIFPQYQLSVYDRETGRTYGRTSRYGSALRPTISPDGAWLVYGTRHEDETGLRIRDLATGEERWLAYPVQRDDQESVASRDVLPGMSFTPDSLELVVSYGGKIWRVPVDGGEPAEIPFRVQTEVELGPALTFTYPVDDARRFTARQIRDAVPSPDGEHLVFAALDRLYVQEMEGGEPRRLTDLDLIEAQPTWSPDGEWVAFVTWSPEGGHVYKTRISGSEAPVRLTIRPAIYQQPAWSSRGDRIAAIQGPARSYQEATAQGAPGASENIVFIPASGGDYTLVAPTDGRRRPHFTSDPDRILLYGNDGLVSIRWDGSDEKAHVKVTGSTPGGSDPASAALVLMAPEGDQAFAQVNNDLYVVTVPRIGGETPTISIVDPDRAIVPAPQAHRRRRTVPGLERGWASGTLVDRQRALYLRPRCRASGGGGG